MILRIIYCIRISLAPMPETDALGDWNPNSLPQRGISFYRYHSITRVTYDIQEQLHHVQLCFPPRLIVEQKSSPFSFSSLLCLPLIFECCLACGLVFLGFEVPAKSIGLVAQRLESRGEWINQGPVVIQGLFQGLASHKRADQWVFNRKRPELEERIPKFKYELQILSGAQEDPGQVTQLLLSTVHSSLKSQVITIVISSRVSELPC